MMRPVRRDRAGVGSVRRRSSYAEAIPLFERILAADPHNLDAALRLATAHSTLGHDAKADGDVQARRGDLADVTGRPRLPRPCTWRKGPKWESAVPLLEQVGRRSRRTALPALEALAQAPGAPGADGRGGGVAAEGLRAARSRPPANWSGSGNWRWASAGRRRRSRPSSGRARSSPSGFRTTSSWALLYLDARRFAEARDALDRVPPSHPEYPMALFKRAQVSVLLNEPDASTRIARARRGADATTRDLIAREKLFQR